MAINIPESEQQELPLELKESSFAYPTQHPLCMKRKKVCIPTVLILTAGLLALVIYYGVTLSVRNFEK